MLVVGGNGGKAVDEKVKQQLSQTDRQLSGLAAQLRAAGLTPEFKKAPKGRSEGKGKG